MEIQNLYKTQEKNDFSNKDLLTMNQKVFRNYLHNQMGYNQREVYLLMKLHKAYITVANIRNYINYAADILYSALVRDELDTIANY